MNIGVIGAGGWGTALACLACTRCHHVVLWTQDAEVAFEINTQRKNSIYLSGIGIPTGIEATTSTSAFEETEMVILAVPTQFIRGVIESHSFPLRDKLIVNAAKGIEQGTHLRISQILREVARISSDNYVVLSGPSHAEEVARGVPTTVVAASTNEAAAELLQQALGTSTFRIYRSVDVVGVELGGALKNVIAIAAGIIDGLEMGDNTKAALVTRGLAEIARLGRELGANPRTFSGLSGLGDLFVTCTSRYSRNRMVGYRIGRGEKLHNILASMKMIAEGVATTVSALELARVHDVELPIVEQVYEILFNGKDPRLAITDLMTRQMKSEL